MTLNNIWDIRKGILNVKYWTIIYFLFITVEMFNIFWKPLEIDVFVYIRILK